MNEITLIRPDDWHCHLREGIFLKHTVKNVAQKFKRAVIMPNLSSPVTTLSAARKYLTQILQHLPDHNTFEPLMTLYLTEEMTPHDILQAKRSECIFAYKLYPASSTTHSEHGIKNFEKIYSLLETLEDANLPLLIHGEISEPEVDIFDREKVFIDTYLSDFVRQFPELKMVLEHISTQYAVDFVREAPANLAATITPHHLWLSRNELFSGGLKPHYYCLPVLKSATDKAALIQAAISGNPKYFLGTDSAPHPQSLKESACCPAGIYNTPTALETVTEIFDRENALDKLENFISVFGAQFYGLPLNTEHIHLQRQPWRAPEVLPYGNEKIIPFRAGEMLYWQVKKA